MAEDKKKEDVSAKKDGLTPEQVEKLKAWIDKKAVDMRCPVCKERKWQPGQYILAPLTRGRKGVQSVGGKTYPMVPVICTNCGYTHLFNALIMGLETPVEEKEEEEEKNG